MKHNESERKTTALEEKLGNELKWDIQIFYIGDYSRRAKDL